MKYTVLVLAAFFCNSLAFLTAVSKISECVNDGSGTLFAKNGTACEKQLTVAMTVEADEGKSQYLEANIRRVHDSTTKQNVQLKKPIRIKVTKSPVLINYRLYQVGYVNHNPHEEAINKKNGWCRDDWFALEREAACGYQYIKNTNKKIFDSQGFCCPCDMNDQRYDRGEFVRCLGHHVNDFGHCLRLDYLYDYVMGFYPPQLVFNITIAIEKMSYTRKNGESFYEEMETLLLSPFKQKMTSVDKKVKAEYIADFHTSDYMPVMAHKYLLVPDPNLVKSAPQNWKNWANRNGFLASIQNPNEWLAVGKEKFGLSGYHCNKIGVSYQAFRNQPNRCEDLYGSCLQGQPHQLWKDEKAREGAGRKGRFMLHNFGKVHYVHNEKKSENFDFQVNFIAQRVRRSLITIQLEADSIKTVINKSPGRIVEAYIDSFEALSSNGLLNIILQNTGSLTATYKVYATHCSAGVDYIPEQMVTISPGEETNVTFTVHSFHAIGKINTCEVELFNQIGDRLDNLTVYFETADTCFCHGHCGCSCGNNVTNCPPPPDKHDEDDFHNIEFEFNGPELAWLNNLNKVLNGNLAALLVSIWVICLLLTLGIFKVGLMLYTGEANCQCCMKSTKKCCDCCCQCIQTVFGKLCSCCFKATTDVAWCCTVCATGKNSLKYIGTENIASSKARRPINCDGMCRGARQARRLHRKKLRVLKRRGARTAKMFAWWEKPYNCTCVVSDTKSIIEIVKGLFFFIYCPILPLWWVIEYAFESFMRRRRKYRRMAAFKKKKALKREKDKKTYLLLDKFTRGTKEKTVVETNFEKQTTKEQNKSVDSEMQIGEKRNNELTLTMELSDDESALELGLSATDTTDTDEAGDIDELLNPGYPVYFNFTNVYAELIPKSLKNPGKNFSIMGRLSESPNGTLTFYLYKYTIQHQQQKKDEVMELAKPLPLDADQFHQLLQPNLALQLVTLAPLFPCLNCEPGKREKSKKRKRKQKKI